jgi:hypothetical protein
MVPFLHLLPRFFPFLQLRTDICNTLTFNFMMRQDTKKIQHTRLHRQIDEILWHPQLVCETLSQSLLEMEETSNMETTITPAKRDIQLLHESNLEVRTKRAHLDFPVRNGHYLIESMPIKSLIFMSHQ